jgi:hypothetical protein
MHEFWRGLFTNSVGHWLSIPTPTHTHIFGNHSSGYSRLNTATCRVQRITVKWNRKWFGFGFRQWRDTVAESLSTHVSIVSMWVSVPAEDGSHQSLFFTHVHKGPVLKYSLMSTNDQYLWVPVGNPALIGLDLPLSTLVGITGRRRKILTCTQITKNNKSKGLSDYA